MSLDLEFLPDLAKLEDWKLGVAKIKSKGAQSCNEQVKKLVNYEKEVLAFDHEATLKSTLKLNSSSSNDTSNADSDLVGASLRYHHQEKIKSLHALVLNMRKEIADLEETNKCRNEELGWLLQTSLLKDEGVRVKRVWAFLREMEAAG